MCRHLAWLGAPRQLTELLLEPEHSLLVQSYTPRTGDGVVVASVMTTTWAELMSHRSGGLTHMPAQNRVQSHPDCYLAELRADVRAGLTSMPKSLPPKYFYDERGSELFDEITRLPEYYPTRTETAILQARASEIAELSRCESLVELGSGTSAKTGLLLSAA